MLKHYSRAPIQLHHNPSQHQLQTEKKIHEHINFSVEVDRMDLNQHSTMICP